MRVIAMDGICRTRLLAAVALACTLLQQLVAQDSLCASFLDSLGTLCVTEDGGDGTCLGRCMTTVNAFNQSCWDHPQLGSSATVLTNLISTCAEERGCMDERYTNYRVEANSQQVRAGTTCRMLRFDFSARTL
eukprot:SAG11_NODE_4593_length_1840_cov_1.538771_2_plen_133_part_00